MGKRKYLIIILNFLFVANISSQTNTRIDTLLIDKHNFVFYVDTSDLVYYIHPRNKLVFYYQDSLQDVGSINTKYYIENFIVSQNKIIFYNSPMHQDILSIYNLPDMSFISKFLRYQPLFKISDDKIIIYSTIKITEDNCILDLADSKIIQILPDDNNYLVVNGQIWGYELEYSDAPITIHSINLGEFTIRMVKNIDPNIHPLYFFENFYMAYKGNRIYLINYKKKIIGQYDFLFQGVSYQSIYKDNNVYIYGWRYDMKKKKYLFLKHTITLNQP
jgi:hypothetical protein